MNNESDLFKHFKNPAESGKEHKTQIQKFLKDRNHAVLAITSMQGSGKTTAEAQVFAKSRDAIFLTQSIDKVKELKKIVNKINPDLDYKVILGLDDICNTYVEDQSIHDYVKELWHIGLYSKDIHRMICHDDECDFLTQDTSYDGRTIQTVKRFEIQITLGNQYHGLHEGRLIMVDEADGILDDEPVDMPALPYDYESHRIDHGSTFLPEIYRINVPEGTVRELMDRYKELIKDVDGNKTEIRNTTQLIRLVTQGFYAVKNRKISELPPIFYIFQKVLERQMKLVIGTASLRNDRIGFNTMQAYFRLAYEKVIADHETKDVTNIEKEQDEEKEKKKLIRFAEKGDYLNNIVPEILEFEASYQPGYQFAFYLPNPNHSFSYSHYRKAFSGVDMELKKKVWKQMRAELIIALKFYERNTGHRPKKVLLITFATVQKQIEKYLKNLQKSRHGNRDELFRNMQIKKFFSNEMHGINANEKGFDLIVTLGDPLDPKTAGYASMMEVEKLNKRGFQLKPESDPALKEMILTTMMSELLEAFHRGRLEIPVISIGNFLAQPDPASKEIIRKITEENGFTVKSIYKDVWYAKKQVDEYLKAGYGRKGNRSRDLIFIESLNEEIRLFFSK